MQNKVNKVIYCGPFDTNGGYKGGINYVVENLYMYYTNLQQHDIDIIPFNVSIVKRKKTSFGKLNFNSIINSIKIYRGLKKMAKIYHPDYIYYNSSTGYPLLKDLLILKRLKKRGFKTIIHIHFAEYNKIVKGRFKYLFLKYLNIMDKVVFLSSNTRQEFLEKGLSTKTYTLYNYHKIHFDATKINNKIEKKSKKLELIFIGSIDNRKGIIDLLYALNKVSRDYLLHVCGQFVDSEVEKKFSEISKELGDKVIFEGYVSGDKKIDLLFNSDILVLPSYGEGLPIVILEGLASGEVILSTNVGAIPEIINNDNGVLISPGQIEKISQFIENIEDDQLKKYRKNNFEYANLYSIDKFYENILNIIKD